MKFVFCEGKDDLEVLQGVAQSIGLTDLSIEQIGGKNNLRNFLKAVQTRPEFSRNLVSSISIIRDADEDGIAALQSVRDALISYGFNAPDQNGGFSNQGMRVGIFIIGPKNGNGILEDLCLSSVSHQKEFRCVEEYFKCISQNSQRKDFSSKAKVRVWMASHTDFEYHTGKAAAAGYWPWDNAAFDPLKNFLKQI